MNLSTLLISGLAFLLGGTLAVRKAVGSAQSAAMIVLAIGLGGALGASLLSALLHPGMVTADSWGLDGGLSFGALVAASITWALSLPTLRVLDSLAPVIGICLAIAKIGCWIKGCCSGIVTTVPWAISQPVGPMLPDLRVHPTQAYELIGALLAAALAWALAKGARPGVAFFAFGLFLSVFRLGNGFFRLQDSVAIFDPRLVTLILAALSLSGLLLCIRLSSHPSNAGTAAA